MKPIDNRLFAALCREAEEAPRRRAHHLIHASHQDPIQRMLIALQPGTYFRPHRHLSPPKWELLLVLKGAAAWLGFDNEGRVTGRLEAGAHKESKGLESPEGTWHALVCLAPDTVIFECKPGPFAPVAPEDFAPWAPPEGATGAAELVRWMLRAQPGDGPAGLGPG
ncbi:MAG: WbuC family cupin fold metalloprotein [Bdellovibrio bacteriovorus]